MAAAAAHTLLVEIERLRAQLAERDRENEQLRAQLAERDRQLERLQQTVRELHQRLADSVRAAKRSAAPFSKGPPKPKPRKPGRKRGPRHGKHGHRPVPLTDHFDETLEAKLPAQCPVCGGTVVETHRDEQFQTEIPRRPIYRKFIIACGHCTTCGHRCRGRHPLQTSDATGAAQSQVGPDGQAAVVYLNKHAGLSYGKVADVFDKFFGIDLTRGAGAQIVLRAGQRLQPVYQQIRERLVNATHLTPDETGWRVGGHRAWLHAWVGDDGATCYVIDPRRGAEVLAQVIGWDWSGNMTHDGCPSYDRFEEAVHQQCVAHVLRRAHHLVEQHTGAAQVFPQQVIDLFQEALAVRDQGVAGQLDQTALEQAHVDYVAELLELTAPHRPNEANAKLANHLQRHSADWFMFLVDPTIPATNHRAEQALKTPIVNRKVWGGNRTPDGAAAQQVTSSVLETCKKKALDAVSFISDAFCGVLGNLFGSRQPDSPGR